MKYFVRAAILFFLLLGMSMSGNAEFVFKKDGTILKGSIINEDSTSIVFKSESGGTEEIKRSDLMRVLYTDLYMGKVYVRLTSGEVIEGYQVDEDRDNYVFRKNINKPDEFTIPRKKVMFIARTNPTDLTAESSIDTIMIKWSPPFKPAKLYKVYMRELKKGEKFRMTGETKDTSLLMKKLPRCTRYEIYVTAISDSGEESLPSEKITASTIPYPVEDLKISEKYSQDGKTETLTLRWEAVTDKESRVKSYNIYKTDDQRKKLGTSKTGEFVIKDFPADGKHWFAVAAVNDQGVESDDARVMYNAGYVITVKVSGAYLVPFGDLALLSDSGYGGLIDITMGKKMFSAGIETGYLSFIGSESDIKNMSIIPFYAMADYRFPLFNTFSLRPVVKAGAGYCMTEYTKHLPLTTETKLNDEFSPMGSAGLFLDFRIADFVITCGAEYSAIFQESGTMSFAGVSFGAGIMF